MPMKRLLSSQPSQVIDYWFAKPLRKYVKAFEKRKQLINEIYLWQPDGTCLWGAMEHHCTKWKGFNDINELWLYPTLNRSLIKRELVFDIDQRQQQIKPLLEILCGSYGTTPLVAFTGNRGFHVHLILDFDPKPWEDIIEEIGLNIYHVKQEILRIFNLLFYTDMLDGVHLIREFYSVHPKTKCFKIPIDTDNPQPRKVKFGQELDVEDISYKDCVWQPPKDLLDRCFERLKDKDMRAETEAKTKGKKKTTNLSYIDKILKHPEKVTDARRRILTFAIIPYLIQQYSEQEVLDTCKDWIERSGKKWDDYKTLVKYQTNFCLKREWNPMSLSKLKKKLR